MREITLSRKLHKKLKEQFPETSRQTVHSALKYFNNSELGKSIRAKAIELLEQELKEAKKLETN